MTVRQAVVQSSPAGEPKPHGWQQTLSVQWFREVDLQREQQGATSFLGPAGKFSDEKRDMDKLRGDITPPQGKKRLLLVVRWPGGGIRTFMRYVYQRFPAELYSFTLIAPDHDETQVLLKDLAGLEACYHPVSQNPTPAELVRAVSGQLLRGRFDMVHSHGFTSGICSAITARLLQVPHLMTIHETLDQRQFSGTKGRAKRLAMSFLLSLIGTIQSVSYDAQDNLLEFFPQLRKRCVVIPNGIDSKHFQSACTRDLRGELELGEGYYLVGFLGRFMSPKGFIHLVDAVETLSRQGVGKKLLVLAFGEGGFIREERAALEKRQLDEYFRFLPFTPEVAGVIKGLDLVAMPSLREACPLLPMETLTCGTPLIASDCIGLREVVQGTPALVVPTGNSGALADGIRYCIERDLRQLFQDYAPVAAQRYDVTKTAGALQEIIRDKAN